MNPHPNCEEFVRVVEDLLARRRAEPRTSERWQGFTRGELIDLVYGSYHDMIHGRIANPPKRFIVMSIAEYLLATSAEINRLLIAAHAPPALVLLEGTELQAALDIAKTVVSYWPIPSYIATRDWSIHGWNTSLLNLWDVTDQELRAIPSKNMHILHLIFDPELPIYHRLFHTSNLMEDVWTYTAKLNIAAFKQSNLLCQNDPWYKNRVTSLMRLPRFAELWHEVKIDTGILLDPPEGRPFPTYSTEIETHGRKVWVLGIQTSVGNFDYPLLISYLPYRDVDRQNFIELGLPTPENRWGTDVKNA
jgi:hypothetical protein